MQLDTLNIKQKEAVTSCDTHIRIVAGAGSGKTRVITARIAYLIQNKNVRPYRILAITFTNKAANEMKQRISAMLECVNTGVNISTIHSLCVRILREDIRYFNYPKNFTILDSDDQKSILKQIYKQLDINLKDISLNQSLSYISNCKCELVAPEEAKAMANKFTNDVIKAEIYALYDNKLKEMYALDFDDLLLFVYKMFNEDATIREKWQNRYDYIHVDEFQDVDKIQYGIIKNLVKEDTCLCVVGDPDQTIYTWRGASVDIIMNLEKDFKNCQSIVLNENYRSTPSILQGANALIKNNTYRIDKDLFTNNNDEGKIEHYRCGDESEEARWIIKKIRTLHKEGVLYRDIAVLYRSNYLSRNLEKSLLDYQIPYRIYGGIKFFERAEIKDAISYLRLLLADNQANELAIRRVINVPKRGVGTKAMENLELLASTYQKDYYTILQEHAIAKGKAQSEIDKFVALIETYRKQVNDLSVSILLKRLLEESGYLKSLEDAHEEERIENLNELIGDIEHYEENEPEGNLDEYLQMISLYTDVENEEQNEGQKLDFVQLMSIHSAKGLEFDYVFVYELSEGVFPNERSINEGGKHALEEERRLAYVAFTRARKKLYLTSSQGFSFVLQKMKSTSRFVKEIDEDVIIHTSDAPSYQKQEYRYNRGDDSIATRKSFVSTNTGTKGKLKKGDLIEHTIFGEGVIISIKDGVAQIAFDKKYGIRKLSATHPSIHKK
ncbi:MAG: ATP-dependent DNA helicase PcrA [Erysipelotrichia bacterium]|nr:ATP-dependent DNA helicase PcrA [Erysipelotrichia bacterium]